MEETVSTGNSTSINYKNISHGLQWDCFHERPFVPTSTSGKAWSFIFFSSFSSFTFLRKVCGLEMSCFGTFPSVLWSEFLKWTCRKKSPEVITRLSDTDCGISVASSRSCYLEFLKLMCKISRSKDKAKTFLFISSGTMDSSRFSQ